MGGHLLLWVCVVALTSFGCTPPPKTTSAKHIGTAALYGRVVAHRPNPLVPGGVQVVPVSGATVTLFRPAFADSVPPGTYWCEYEGYADSAEFFPPLRKSGWLILHQGRYAFRGRLEVVPTERPLVTDESGRFAMTGLPPGRYALQYAHPDYHHGFSEFHLPDSAVTRTFLTKETFIKLVPTYVVNR